MLACEGRGKVRRPLNRDFGRVAVPRQVQTLLSEHLAVRVECLLEVRSESGVWVALVLHYSAGAVRQKSAWRLHILACRRSHLICEGLRALMRDHIVALPRLVHLANVTGGVAPWAQRKCLARRRLRLVSRAYWDRECLLKVDVQRVRNLL